MLSHPEYRKGFLVTELMNESPDNARLTISEAEVVTGVGRTHINRILDDGHFAELWGLERGLGRRLLNLDHCVFLLFHEEAGRLLAPRARREIWYKYIEKVSVHRSNFVQHTFARNEDCLIVFAETLSVDLTRHCREVEERWLALVRSRHEIISDPDIRGGAMVIEGTRIGVYEVADVVQNASAEEALEIYPSLSRDKVDAAVIYAKAHPKVGRPVKKSNWRSEKARLKSSRMIARTPG